MSSAVGGASVASVTKTLTSHVAGCMAGCSGYGEVSTSVGSTGVGGEPVPATSVEGYCAGSSDLEIPGSLSVAAGSVSVVALPMALVTVKSVVCMCGGEVCAPDESLDVVLCATAVGPGCAG